MKGFFYFSLKRSNFVKRLSKNLRSGSQGCLIRFTVNYKLKLGIKYGFFGTI